MIPLLDATTLRAHKLRNTLHAAALLGGLGAVTAGAAYLLWGPVGIGVTLATLVLVFILSPRVPPDVVMRLYGAVQVPPEHGGQLTRLIQTLARRADLGHQPDLYVIPSMTLNAFAAGTPARAAIGVTEGLLRQLTMREIAGVLAHETSHIRNNDVHVMGLADLLSRFAQSLAYVAVALAGLNLLAHLNGDRTLSWWPIVLLYLAPALSSLLQLGLSRTREFDADLEAAQLTGDPLALASALRRLDRHTGQAWEDLMLPVPGRRVPQPSLLRTHPLTEDRVARLVALTQAPVADRIAITDEPMVSMVGWGPAAMRPRYRWPGVWY